MPKLSLISITAQQSDFSSFLTLKKFYPFFFSGMLCKFQFRFASDAYTSIFWAPKDKVLFLQGSPGLTRELSIPVTWRGQAGCRTPHLHTSACASPAQEPPLSALGSALLRNAAPICELARWQTEPQTHMYLCLFSPFASKLCSVTRPLVV